jgi:hypothetical protein
MAIIKEEYEESWLFGTTDRIEGYRVQRDEVGPSRYFDKDQKEEAEIYCNHLQELDNQDKLIKLQQDNLKVQQANLAALKEKEIADERRHKEEINHYRRHPHLMSPPPPPLNYRRDFLDPFSATFRPIQVRTPSPVEIDPEYAEFLKWKKEKDPEFIKFKEYKKEQERLEEEQRKAKELSKRKRLIKLAKDIDKKVIKINDVPEFSKILVDDLYTFENIDVILEIATKVETNKEISSLLKHYLCNIDKDYDFWLKLSKQSSNPCILDKIHGVAKNISDKSLACDIMRNLLYCNIDYKHVLETRDFLLDNTTDKKLLLVLSQYYKDSYNDYCKWLYRMLDLNHINKFVFYLLSKTWCKENNISYKDMNHPKLLSNDQRALLSFIYLVIICGSIILFILAFTSLF